MQSGHLACPPRCNHIFHIAGVKIFSLFNDEDRLFVWKIFARAYVRCGCSLVGKPIVRLAFFGIRVQFPKEWINPYDIMKINHNISNLIIDHLPWFSISISKKYSHLYFKYWEFQIYWFLDLKIYHFNLFIYSFNVKVFFLSFFILIIKYSLIFHFLFIRPKELFQFIYIAMFGNFLPLNSLSCKFQGTATYPRRYMDD